MAVLTRVNEMNDKDGKTNLPNVLQPIRGIELVKPPRYSFKIVAFPFPSTIMHHVSSWTLLPRPGLDN